MTEIQEREYRKYNLIPFNVKESKSEDPETCRTHDIMRVSEVCEELGEEVEIEKAIRLGKKPEDEGARQRCLKIILKTEDMNRKLLFKTKTLREAMNDQKRQEKQMLFKELGKRKEESQVKMRKFGENYQPK